MVSKTEGAVCSSQTEGRQSLLHYTVRFRTTGDESLSHSVSTQQILGSLVVLQQNSLLNI